MAQQLLEVERSYILTSQIGRSNLNWKPPWAMLKTAISEDFLAPDIDSMSTHNEYFHIEVHCRGRGARVALGSVLYACTFDIQRTIIASQIGL